MSVVVDGADATCVSFHAKMNFTDAPAAMLLIVAHVTLLAVDVPPMVQVEPIPAGPYVTVMSELVVEKPVPCNVITVSVDAGPYTIACVAVESSTSTRVIVGTAFGANEPAAVVETTPLIVTKNNLVVIMFDDTVHVNEVADTHVGFAHTV